MMALVTVLGEERYGISTDQAREVIFYQHPTPVPRTPPFVRGVVNLRGQILPVVDMRERFGMPPREPGYIVVLQIEELLVGVTVDDVEGVETVEDEDIRPPSRMLATVDNRFLRGVVQDPAGLLMILDVTLGLLREDEVRILGEMGQEADRHAV